MRAWHASCEGSQEFDTPTQSICCDSSRICAATHYQNGLSVGILNRRSEARLSCPGNLPAAPCFLRRQTSKRRGVLFDISYSAGLNWINPLPACSQKAAEVATPENWNVYERVHFYFSHILRLAAFSHGTIFPTFLCDQRSHWRAESTGASFF